MSVRQDRVQITVDTDAKQSINELGKLEAEAFDLRKTVAGLKKDTDEYREANARLSEVTKQINERREALGVEGMTTRQLRNYVRELRAEQENTATAGTARYEELGAKIQQATAKLDAHAKATRGLKVTLDQVRERVDVAVIVDGSPAVNELRKVEAETVALESHVHTLKRGTDEWVAATAALDDSRERVAQLRQELGTSGMTMQQLKGYAADLQRELDEGAVAGTAHYEQQREKIQQVNGAIEQQRAELKAVSVSLDEVAARGAVGVVVDGGATTNELSKLEGELGALQQHLRTLRPESAAAAAAIERIGATEARIGVLRKELGTAGMTMQQLKAYAKALETQLETTAVRGTQHYEALSAELQQVTGAIQKQQKEVSGMSGIWKSIGSEVKQFGALALGALGLQFLAQQVTNLIQKNADLADSFSDIEKTTGMTTEEVAALNAQFSRMNTRTPTKDLREIAIAAGQLGQAKEDIYDFTAATDKLVVSLGDEFQGGAAEVTKVMGGLRNVFSDIKSDDVATDMLHIGNAINVLASEGAATGPVVADMANRIGGVGIVLGETSAQVLGLAATMQELNIETERGATAVTKILQKMAAEPDKFAKTAGLSVREFKRLVDTDLNAAFIAVVKGAAGSNTAATQLAATLDKMGVDGAGASEVIAKLGQNTEMLAEKQERAATALGGTSSIMEEFNKKNNNAAANLERISKWFGGLFVNSKFKESLNDITESLARMLGLIDEAENAAQRFEQRKGSSDRLRRDIMPLVKEYEKLSENTERSAKEQARLEQIIKQVTDAVPQAAREWTMQGKAVAINTDRVREYALELDGVLNGDRKAALTRLNKELASVQRQIAESLPGLNEQKKTIRVTGLEKGEYRTESAAMSGSDIKLKAAEIEALWKRGEQLQAMIDHINGKQTQAEMQAEWKRGDQERAAALAKAKQAAQAAAAETDGLLEAIDKKIKAAQERMQKAQTQGGINSARAEIAALEKQRDELNGSAAERRAKEAEERRKEREKRHQEAVKGLGELEKIEAQSRERVALEQMGADRREVLEVRRKYDALKAEAMRYSTDARLTAAERNRALVTLANLAAAEELEVDQKKREQQHKRDEESWKAYREVQERKAAFNVMLADDELKAATAAGDTDGQRAAIDHKRDALIADLELRKDLELDSITATEANEARRKAIIDEYNLKIKQARAATDEELQQLDVAAIDRFAGFANQAGQALSQVLQATSQNELTRVNRDKAQRLQSLDNEYRYKRLSEEQYQRRKAQIEQEADQRSREAQRKQAEEEQALRIVQTVINTAAAVMRAAAMQNYAEALAVGVLGGIQVGVIASQQIPAFVEGGFTARELAAMPRQNLSRSAGGMLPTGPFMATVNEAGPEYFIPNRLLSDPAVLNHVAVIESIRTTGRYPDPPAFVAGGSTAALPELPAPMAAGNTPSDLAKLGELTAMLARLNQNLENPREARARLVWGELEDAGEEIKYIRQQAK